MELTLLRHAPPPREYHGCYNGHTDIPIEEALFAPEGVQPLLHRRFDRIFSSDLQRCTATLEMIGFTTFTPDIRLREVRFKPSVEGKLFSEIEALDDFSPHVLKSKESWHHYICDESLPVFQARIQNFLNGLNHDEVVLICTHGGTIDMILSLLDPNVTHKSLKYLEHITITLG